MTKVLLINPNKWGRGITHIWIASHTGLLKKNNIKVELFDCTFYEQWSLNEIKFQSENKMYKKSDYDQAIKFSSKNIYEDLQNKIDSYKPDVIFWSSISSHIHAEGEYVNIQNGYDLISKVNTSAIKITGGLQATANPKLILNKMNKIDYLIGGESELVLLEVCKKIANNEDISSSKGLSYVRDGLFIKNENQNIIENLDIISPYDYDIFDDQVFLRPYNGNVIKAVDYELSRGCIYSCNYCVETIIQNYYSFKTVSKTSGAIGNFKNYLRSKSAKTIFEELEYLNKKKNIKMIRCQDTNFLTNKREILEDLSKLIDKSNLDIFMYIETRPEGINDKSIELLKKLKIDGVGLGVELSDEKFRNDYLNRFADQEKTINAFKLLKKNNIKRTAYNIIGLPNQDEKSILDTIEFNKVLDPDNITVAFYSPYYGTRSHYDSVQLGNFDDYEEDVDSALRSKSKNKELSVEILEKYKRNFVSLVRSE